VTVLSANGSRSSEDDSLFSDFSVSGFSGVMRREAARDLAAGDARRERVFRKVDLDDLRFWRGGRAAASMGSLGSLAPGRVS
jgi:hypothetical protein